MYRWEVLQHLARSRVVGIVRTGDAESALATAERLVDAGMTTIEIALTTPGGLSVVGALAAAHPDVLVGAGTVLTPAAASAAAEAGARFLLAPNLEPAVVRTGHSLGLAVIPGAATPTEIVAALAEGADAVKVFPVSDRSPGWLRDVRAALPHAPLVPTGGVTLDGVAAWIAAGAVACGMGSALTAGKDVDLTARVTALQQRVGVVRGPRQSADLGGPA